MDEGVVFSAATRKYLAAMPVSPADVVSYWGRIQAQIDGVDAEVAQGPGLPRDDGRRTGIGVHRQVLERRGFTGQPLRRWVWSTAAVLLGVLLTVTGWRMGERQISQNTAASMMTYATGNGERATIALPDGGTVALNVASRLEVPMDYMSGHHTVRLVGEGLFTVSHHTGAPLTVIAGGTHAQVLGTRFVVRRYATDTAAMVAVQDGKVAVGATVVTANQVAEVGQRGVPHIGRADGSLFTFATGMLTVNGLPLPAAIVELDRWYDADIRLGDSALAKMSLHGTFGSGSLGDLTEVLEATYDVHVVRQGRVLTLYSKR